MLLGLLWIVLCVSTDIKAQWVIEEDGCRTPDRGVGSCILIKDCQPVITFITEAPKPLSAKNAALLRSYQCDFEGREVKVCCPSGPVTDGSTSTTEAIPDPPDVTNHRNIDLLPTDCGYLSTDDKIINGNQTGLFEFPWMALLSYRGVRGPEFKCGGTVINDRYILTAAHCISGLTRPLLGIRVGEHDISQKTDCEVVRNKRTCAPPVQDLGIEQLIPHPQYNSEPYSNDIGLIRVSTRMNLSVESVRPVCLPQETLGRYNYTGRNVIDRKSVV